MRLLMKFGGTSVANERCISRVVNILEHYHSSGNEIAVVVSAMSGITDQLHAVAAEVVEAHDKPPIDMFIHSMSTRHQKVLHEVAPGTAVYNLRELTPRSFDYIISFGERLSAIILSAALREAGVASSPLNGCEAGIITNGRHGCAEVLPESENHIKSRVGPLLVDSVPVIMGYMGCTRDGIVTTLGRSGSDYSGAIIGAAIDADEIWIWTDVLSDVSYLEAMELSYFGAKVLHPRSIEPAMQKDILVRVKNTFNPSHPGSCVIRSEHRDKRVVKAISYIEKVSLINISGAQMIGRPGVAHAIFSSLADREINVMMISQGSSEANISIIVDDEHLNAAIEGLTLVKKNGYVREVTYDRDVIAVAVVGVGMAGSPGISGRIFTALGNAEVNVMMISQGSSEVNVSFVVRREDGPCALRVLHDEFELSKEITDE